MDNQKNKFKFIHPEVLSHVSRQGPHERHGNIIYKWQGAKEKIKYGCFRIARRTINHLYIFLIEDIGHWVSLTRTV